MCVIPFEILCSRINDLTVFVPNWWKVGNRVKINSVSNRSNDAFYKKKTTKFNSLCTVEKFHISKIKFDHFTISFSLPFPFPFWLSKVVRMFIAVVTIFAICWLPYHLFYVYSYHRPHITSSNYVPHLFLAFYWLAMSNSMVNPIIYYWMNRRFRHYFQKIMCFCCFHLWQQNELLKSETVYMPNSMSIERRSKSCKYP